MNTINYSIIIPHKNTPDLLQRCLNSIPYRDDIQVIVVDDNSDSSIVDFSHFPGMGEPNVEILFTKEGKGAGYARNIGLQHAKGKWLLFADSDDYYAGGFIEKLDIYMQSNYDIIYFNVYGNSKGEHDRGRFINSLYSKYFRGEIGIEEVKYLIWAPWNKMFSSRFILKNKILFDEIPVGNDAFFSLKSGEKTSDVLVINDKLYCITWNSYSISFQKRSYEREFDYLIINQRINVFLRKHGLDDKQMTLISRRTIFLFKYGFRKMLFYLKYIHQKDSIRRYLYLYLRYLLTKKRKERT